MDDLQNVGPIPLDVLGLIGAAIPATPDEAFALSHADWSRVIEDTVASASAWPADYATNSPIADDGSLLIDSGVGFFAAVAMLSALGFDALSNDDLRDATFTSITSVTDLVYRVAQEHRNLT